MNGKIYQMTEEQLNFLANDLIGILQKSEEVSDNLNNHNLDSIKILNEYEKYNDINENIDFLLNKMHETKEGFESSFNGVEELKNSLLESSKKLDNSSSNLEKKIDIALKKIESFDKTKTIKDHEPSENEKSRVGLFIAFIIGFSVLYGWLLVVYGFEVNQKIYGDSLKTIDKYLEIGVSK